MCSQGAEIHLPLVGCISSGKTPVFLPQKYQIPAALKAGAFSPGMGTWSETSSQWCIIYSAAGGKFPVKNGGVVSHGTVKNQSMLFDVIAVHHSNSSGRAQAGHCSLGYCDVNSEHLAALMCWAHTSHYLNCKSATVLAYKHVEYCLC